MAQRDHFVMVTVVPWPIGLDARRQQLPQAVPTGSLEPGGRAAQARWEHARHRSISPVRPFHDAGSAITALPRKPNPSFLPTPIVVNLPMRAARRTEEIALTWLFAWEAGG